MTQDNLTLLTTTYAPVADTDLDLFAALKAIDGDISAFREWVSRRKLPKPDVANALKAYRVYAALGTRIKTPQDFTEAVIKKLNLSIAFDGMITRTQTDFAAQYTLANLTDDVISANYEHEAGFADSALKVEVSRWVQRSKDSAMRAIGQRIFDDTAPRCDEMWLALAKAIGKPGAVSDDYVVAVLQTFLWQVKRKMAGLEIAGHLMPILTGGQGNGKTTFLRNLLAPVLEVATFASFREAFDSRNLGIWSSAVIVFDEMEKCDTADINAVKSALTGTTRTARVMAKNTVATVRQQATLIGAMNGRIGEVLRDSTGMRRYGPLPTGDVPGRGKTGVDWEVINQTDYIALWRSVRVSDPRPVDRVSDELRALQDAERSVDPVEYYLKHEFHLEEIVRKRRLRDTDAISASDLHRDFSDIMRQQFPSHKPINVQSFGAKVTACLDEEWCPLSYKEAGKLANFYHIKAKPVVADGGLDRNIPRIDGGKRAA